MSDEPGPGGKIVDVGGRNGQGWPPSGVIPEDFPFPLAEPRPEPVTIMSPCGCTSMIFDPPDGQPAQVSWCVPHDPGYTPPGQTPPEAEQ